MAATWRLAAVPMALHTLAVLGFVGLSVAINEGWFVYVLDDAYIHLELSRHLAMGEHAYNTGEVTAPSSSVIWPFLLVPFWWTGGAWWAPLVLNVLFGWLAIGAFAAASRRILGDDPGRAGVLVVVVLVVVGHLVPLAHAGMEHTLQVALTAWIAVALIDLDRDRPPPAWLVPACWVLPLVRFEGLGLVGLTAMWLLARGRRGAGLAAGLGAVALVGGYSLFLLQTTGFPLPHSVLSRRAMFGSAIQWDKLLMPQVLLLLALGGGLAARLARKPLRDGVVGWIAIACTVGHLVLAQAGGGFNRYLAYVTSLLVLAMAWTFRDALRTAVATPGDTRRITGWVVAFLLLVAARVHTFDMFNSGHIYREQWQMRRIATEVVDGPVAVNDIGLVALDNDHYVLDLVGLASTEALEHLLAGDPPQDWMADLASAHHVEAVLLFRSWFDALPEAWTHVATLRVDWPTERPAHREVWILAPSADQAPALAEGLRAFAPSLPPRSRLVFE